MNCKKPCLFSFYVKIWMKESSRSKKKKVLSPNDLNISQMLRLLVFRAHPQACVLESDQDQLAYFHFLNVFIFHSSFCSIGLKKD